MGKILIEAYNRAKVYLSPFIHMSSSSAITFQPQPLKAMELPKLHIFVFPYFTTSHMMTLVQIARLLAARGVSVTIVTTHFNAQKFETSIDHDKKLTGHQISIHKLQFPFQEVGLPEGLEDINAATSFEQAVQISKGVSLLQKRMEQLIRHSQPHCIISDMFFPWTVDIAQELRIPRISVDPTGVIPHCIRHSLRTHVPNENESFVIPGLPHPIHMLKSQLPEHAKIKTRFGEVLENILNADLRSYGNIVNSCLELEHDYIQHFREVQGRRCFHIGPLSLFLNRMYGKSTSSLVDHEYSNCFNWLDSQKPKSVVYISFGSLTRFSNDQLNEIALALEDTGKPFIWVVRSSGNTCEDEKWLRNGFEKMIKERNSGILIRGWAPQVMILEHRSIGGFITHCGWNSVLEAVTAGVPLITWPLFAEQFYNEKLITQVLKIGVEVGSENWSSSFVVNSPVVGKEQIVKAVNHLMGDSEEAERVRNRAEELKEKVHMAVEEGGSSDSSLSVLITELRQLAAAKGDM